jgi:enoyl-CoA hydratase
MPYTTIRYERDNKVRRIILNRPDVYNAISGECREEIHSALNDTAHDRNAQALIIAGHEKFFCAGADIKDVMNLETAALATEFSLKFQRLFQEIEEMKKPVIAAVSGFALGGGCELALSCDVRIVSESASFGLSEINIGAFPAGGGTQKLPRLIGTARAKELLFTGERINAQQAYNMGLANRVVPDDECLNEAMRWAEKLAGKSPSAMTAIKLLVNTGMNMDLKSALVLESETFGALSTHRDFKEGVSAFLEKRKPHYRGNN